MEAGSGSIFGGIRIMIVLPAWLWIGSRLKASLWLLNRLATWTGLAYLWKRRPSSQGRSFWVRATIINLLSLGGLILLFYVLRRFSIQ